MNSFYESAIASVPRPTDLTAGGEKFWRMEPPVLSPSRALVKGGMFEHQLRWWTLPNFIKVLVGGYGSGKTLVLCKRVIALAMENAPCPVAVISPTFFMARETVIRTLKNLLAGKKTLYGSSFYWRYNSTYHTFTIRYHGREGLILIYSSDNPDSLRGPNLAAAGIDEPFLQPEEVLQQMVARVRHPDSKVREILATGTPEQLNWGYDLCEGDLGDYDVGVVRASTRWNLALPADYITHLEGAFADKEASAFIEGEFVNLAKGAVYYSFDPHDNMVSLNRPAGSQLGCGMDFNVNPMAMVVFWTLGKHMHIFAEHELPNADTEYACSMLRDSYWADGLREIYPDASGRSRHTNAPGGKSDFHFIKEAGFTINAHEQNPLRKDRYNAVNGKLKSRLDRVTLTIDPSCKKLKKYLSVYSHELMTKQEQMSHLLDAMGYPIAYLFPVSKDHVDAVRFGGY